MLLLQDLRKVTFIDKSENPGDYLLSLASILPIGKIAKLSKANKAANLAQDTAKLVDNAGDLRQGQKLLPAPSERLLLQAPKPTIDIQHIIDRHAFDAVTDASKFNQGMNIQKLVNESVNMKPYKNVVNNGNIVKEYSYVEVIGSSNNKVTKNFRVVYSNDGSKVITAYPIP